MPKHRLTKIVTRTGDKGQTSLNGKLRINKNALILDVIGGLDELNSAIGLVVAHLQSSKIKISHKKILDALTEIQNHLFDIGGDLCQPKRKMISQKHVIFLEKTLNNWNATLPPLKEFILPRGSISAATCHLARAICRRLERAFVSYATSENIASEILCYINRLSDLLFVAARMIDKNNKKKIEFWKNVSKT